MMKINFALPFLFCLGASHAWSQIHADSGPLIKSPLATSEFFTDVSGRPVFPSNYVDVSGTPFAYEDWRAAAITLGSGRKLAGVQVKLDLLKHEVYYIDERGKEMIAKRGVIHQISFPDKSDSTVYRSGFPALEENTTATLYEVLADGRVVLLKQTTKVIQELKRFNSATIERKFVLREAYFLFHRDDKKMKTVRRDRKVVVEALADRQESVQRFLDENRNRCRTEADLVDVVTYYNALQ